MSESNLSTAHQRQPARRDHFIHFTAIGLPLVNQALYWGIRLTGGAHRHGYLIAAITIVAESLLISWFCATKTNRQTWTWSVIGGLLNIVVSVAGIYAVTFVTLAVSYAGGGSS